jgi:hypothetical protein
MEQRRGSVPKRHDWTMQADLLAQKGRLVANTSYKIFSENRENDAAQKLPPATKHVCLPQINFCSVVLGISCNKGYSVRKLSRACHIAPRAIYICCSQSCEWLQERMNIYGS